MKDLFVANQDTETQRICGTCEKLKDLDQFYKDGKVYNNDGTYKIRYRRDCKECYKLARYKESIAKSRR